MANIFRRILVFPYEQWYLHRRAAGEVDGIALIDYPRNTPYLRETFVTALKFLEQRDPRRFRRVKKHVKRIVNFPLGYSGAGYIQHLKAYATNFQPPKSEASIPKVAVLEAGMLAHEATHGLLHERGIPYTARTRERIEKLCWAEEHRVYDHAGLTPESLAKLKSIRKFDPEYYRKRWSASFFQRIRDSVKYEKQAEARRKQSDVIQKP